MSSTAKQKMCWATKSYLDQGRSVSGRAYPSSIHCDELVSLPKVVLTDYVGSLSRQTLGELANALAAALGIEVI